MRRQTLSAEKQTVHCHGQQIDKPPQFMVLDAKPGNFSLYEKLVIYTVESFSKVDKHRCSNAAFVNAFPNTIREICYRVQGRVIFFRKPHWKGDTVVDWTYLNDGVTVFAQLFQGFSKPPVKRRWGGR